MRPLILLSLFFSLAVQAELSPASYLKKVSMHIRGTMPTTQEYADLAKAEDKNQFIATRMDEYLKSRSHVDKMEFRLHELFQTRTPSGPKDLTRPLGYEKSNLIYSDYNTSLSDLFRSTALPDATWDELLTSRKYAIHEPYYEKGRPRNSYNGELEFYSAFQEFREAFPLSPVDYVTPRANSFTSPMEFTEPVPFAFTENDPRIAGVLTSSRFFGRYTNSALNKNRRRAAAVFRIFLCDDMKAQVVSDKSNLKKYLDIAFPKQSFSEAEMQAATTSVESKDIHGSRKDCMSCHYKLDPMGQAFQLSGRILSPTPSRGRLTYQNLKGEITDIPVTGLGALGESITKQPEYAQCQVRHFWTWFIGKDRPLTQDRLEELTSEFDRLDRKTNAFIKHLMTQPEFKNPERDTPEKRLARNARAVLQNCTHCHNSMEMPSFAEWPIDGSTDSHKQWIHSISEALDLANDGAKKTMPPQDSPWQPSPEDLRVLKEWISAGTPDLNGVKP